MTCCTGGVPAATVKDCCSRGAAKNAGDPAWSALSTHVPAEKKLTCGAVAGSMPQTAAAEGSTVTVTGSPDVDPTEGV